MLFIAAVSIAVTYSVNAAETEALSVFSPEECFQSGTAQSFQMTVGTRDVLH